MLNEEEDANLLLMSRAGDGGVVGGPVVGHYPVRRESIFYRPSISDSDSSPVSLSRKISGNSELLPEDLLITPFAQILHNLKNVRNNYVTLTESYVPSVDRSNTSNINKGRKNSLASSSNEISDSDAARMCVETLEDLDWCLVQLEKMHTHRSVSDMATTKFKRILSRELNQFSETGSSASEVSEYINSTFLDKHKEDQLPAEADAANEYHVTRRDSDLQSNSSSGGKNNSTSQETIKAKTSANSSSNNSNNISNSSDNSTNSNSSNSTNRKISTVSRCNSGIKNAKNKQQTKAATPVTAAATPTTTSHHSNRSSSSGSDHCKYCRYGDHKHLWAVSRHLKAPLIVPISQEKSENNKQLLDWLARSAAASQTSPLADKANVVKQISVGANRIEMALQDVSDWSFDVFQLSDVTNERPLLILTSYLFQKHNLLKTLNISSTLLHNFLNSVELNYNRKNPYHNNIHAADVVQTTYWLTQTPSIKDCFTDMDLVSILIAAAIHDVDHPGVTNQYLINSELDLAILYNDRSVLENHHLAVGFTILKDRGVNIFRNIPSAVYRGVRRLIIDMVLATDMSMHLKLVADLKTTLETKKVIVADTKTTRSLSSPQPLLFLSSSSSSSTSMMPNVVENGKKLVLDNAEDKKQVLQTLIHCADLGNPCKPLSIFQSWVGRVMKEFFNQGDMEKEQGLDVSPMCNRDMISVEKAQVGFIDYIALPLWEAWDELVNNECQESLDNLLYNRDWFEKEEKRKQNN